MYKFRSYTLLIFLVFILLLLNENVNINALNTANLYISLINKNMKSNNKRILNNVTCDSFYLKNMKYFDTAMSFEDKDIRRQFFPIIKEIYPSPRDDDIVLDIGGNIGDITYMMNKYFPDINIFTIEPVPNYYRQLLKRFEGIKNINIYNLAIGNSTTDKEIKYDQWHYMMIVNRRLNEKEKAHFMRLDRFYDNFTFNRNVLFLKIDVEGYEDEVLFTGENLLKSRKVKLIYYEYHRSKTIWCKTKNSFLIHYLENFGYKCYALGKFKLIRLKEKCLNEYDRHIYSHTIAIRDDEKIEDILIQSYNSKFNSMKYHNL